MKIAMTAIAVFCLVTCRMYADGTNPTAEAEGFVRQVLKISMEQFFRDVDVRLGSPLNNKRLMSNKRIMASYTPQEGDLYCDVSHVKEGVENFIAYDKAFLYIIRKVDGKWTLIGIGG